jgi:hypothetical protein
MPKELKAELSIVKMQFVHGDTYLDEDYPLLAFATTKIPDEVRAKYFRYLGISTVCADVHVEARGDLSFQLDAIVRVILTYKGDMVRSSERTREKIDQRLHELAQQYCAEMAHEEIVETAKQERI